MSTEITVMVLNYNQRDLLARCLEACQRLDEDGIRVRLVVVDNGSTDGAPEEVRRRFPGVGVMANRRNVGFARAYNAAVPAAETEWVALLNNDTIPQPSWLTAAVETARRHRAACVGSRMLKDAGASIDYVGTTMNFYGHGFHPRFGDPAADPGTEGPVIAPCGGAMLIRRDVFLEAGGFDEEYFAYFEDLDLGWRLNVLGHEILYSPESVVHHEHSATNGRLVPGYQKLTWHERNALRSVIKNYGQERLARVLPAALALAVKRAQLESAVDPDLFFFEKTALGLNGSGPRESGPRSAWTRLVDAARTIRARGPIEGPLFVAYALLSRRFGPRPHVPRHFDVMDRNGYSRIAAIQALVDGAEELKARRAAVQQARRRSDESVIELFRDTFRCPFPHPDMKLAQDRVVSGFELRELFPEGESVSAGSPAEASAGH